MVDVNEITEQIIGAAIEVHRALGPGLLESAYEECLCHDLKLAGLSVERQRALPVEYRGIRLECGYRLDLLVENAVVVEIKGWKVGLLINFNVSVLKNGIRRRVL
jgi:GxxExxY protein